jgi:hypothetical protein
MCLERGPLSLVKIIEELLERKVPALVQKTDINGRWDSSHRPLDILYPKKLALTSTSGGRSVGIVRLLTKIHGACFVFVLHSNLLPLSPFSYHRSVTCMMIPSGRVPQVSNRCFCLPCKN